MPLAKWPGRIGRLLKNRTVEEIFGWMKTVGGMRKTRYRGKQRVGLHFHLTTAAYNLVRMAKLLPSAA